VGYFSKISPLLRFFRESLGECVMLQKQNKKHCPNNKTRASAGLLLPK
jgi:hypothetical protein